MKPSDPSRQPMTDVGDVMIHHMAPRVWVPCPITKPGDIRGCAMRAYPTPTEAIVAARTFALPGCKVYIWHHDDRAWEFVEQR